MENEHTIEVPEAEQISTVVDARGWPRSLSVPEAEQISTVVDSLLHRG